VTQAGMYIMTLFDWYSGGLNVIIIALCEVAGIAWIYGINPIMYIILASTLLVKRLDCSNMKT